MIIATKSAFHSTLVSVPVTLVLFSRKFLQIQRTLLEIVLNSKELCVLKVSVVWELASYWQQANIAEPVSVEDATHGFLPNLPASRLIRILISLVFPGPSFQLQASLLISVLVQIRTPSLCMKLNSSMTMVNVGRYFHIKKEEFF